MIALVDWRRGWLLAIVCGVLQDPVRKMTPGTPVWLTGAVLVVYAAALFPVRPLLMQNLDELSRRFAGIARNAVVVFLFLGIATMNGLVTFGLAGWKAPMVSLFLYLAPLPAVVFGYTYLQREETLYRFFRFYAIVTSVALIGTLLEYLRVQHPSLGLVAGTGDYIRHITGIQIRMISGFYRGPDTMGYHAATLSAIGIAMAVRGGLGARAWPWFLATGWGFFCTMISGRRKAIYFIAVFALIFLWRYFRRLRMSQILASVLAATLMWFIVDQLSTNERTSVYARGAATTRGELAQRLEGGMLGTIRQAGVLGLGLGTATQGVRHFLGSQADVGWQEGGLAKLTVELGVPGLIAALFLAWSFVTMSLRLTRIGDVPGSSQLARVTLFALVAANAATFTASAQPFTDPLLALTAAFFAGCLFATAALDERLAATAPATTAALTPATA